MGPQGEKEAFSPADRPGSSRRLFSGPGCRLPSLCKTPTMFLPVFLLQPVHSISGSCNININHVLLGTAHYKGKIDFCFPIAKDFFAISRKQSTVEFKVKKIAGLECKILWACIVGICNKSTSIFLPFIITSSWMQVVNSVKAHMPAVLHCGLTFS